MSMKTYEAHVQFEAIWIKVKARNKAEAWLKVRAKLLKRNILHLMDKRNCFMDEL